MKYVALWKICIFIALFTIIEMIAVSYFDPSNGVAKQIKNNVKSLGAFKAVVHYTIETPILEERDYRLWALLFVFLFKKISLRNPLFWLSVIVPTYIWTVTIHDAYSYQCQFLIFCGGLFNGGLILYFSQFDQWQKRINAILAPIIAHAEVNFIVVVGVILKNGLS